MSAGSPIIRQFSRFNGAAPKRGKPKSNHNFRRNQIENTMKNQLSPLAACNSSSGYEPALVKDGYRPRLLPASGYTFRPDLNGLVHHQDGAPIVECDGMDALLNLVLDPTDETRAAWVFAVAEGRREPIIKCPSGGNHDWDVYRGPGPMDRGAFGPQRGQTFLAQCRKCGVHRTERTAGSYEHPDDQPALEYEMLDAETVARLRAGASEVAR